MTEKKCERIHNELFQKRKELLDRLERINISKRRPHSRDDEDQAIERENDEVVDLLEENIRRELQLIDNALSRIEKGIYDTCSKCGEKIEEKRLEALPHTDLCVECACG